jgi:hypothetical protein
VVRRSGGWVILLALALATLGCNKAKGIITDAEATYAAGDPVGAAHTLERLRTEAPDAPELTRATMLAVQWLSEAADQAEKQDRRRELLDEALVWEPDNARTRSARCRIEFEDEAWHAARSCVEAGRDVIPTDRLERFDELLAGQARTIEQAAERESLLASADPDDWRRLRRRYGGSLEAVDANDKLLAASLCEDLFRFTEPLRMQGSGSPLDWGDRLGREGDRNGQVTVLTEVREQAERLATSLQEQRTALQGHGVLPGEESIQASLLESYGAIEPPLERLLRAYRKKVYKVEDRTAAVARFGQDTQQLVLPLREARKGAEASCDDLREAWLQREAARGR